MRSSVTLLMAIHCHQPVGNLHTVIEEAYTKAYDPFLRVLERHPTVRLALHYSGVLLDWFSAHRPEFLGRVRALVARGQVELLAGGYYEPILPLIPEEDRQGQLAMMRQVLWTRFGAEATGLWLTERVWEPELPGTLAHAGLRYTMVDTNQFAVAKRWLSASQQVEDQTCWDLLGSYTTEYAGASVRLFPSSKRLRYWLPFQPVERTIAFLKGLRREDPATVTFADDGEKFGLWPRTFRWVYEEGWLERFFSALERERGWLSTTMFRDYVRTAAPDGHVYLPCGSYEEMLEWSSGSFRNFFLKYPEAHAMQQKMLHLSARLRAVSAEGLRRHGRKAAAVTINGTRLTCAQLLERARRELYMAQCNCAYWHGVFGGLYLAHLRRAVYTNLITAEQLLDAVQPAPRRGLRPCSGSSRASEASRGTTAAHARAGGGAVSVTVLDADGDDHDELRLRSPDMSLLVDPADGGTLTEWDLAGPRINLLDTVSRRPEPYHETVRARRRRRVHAALVPGEGGAMASIHEVLGVKDEQLPTEVWYDDHRRSAFVDYALERLPTLEEVVRSTCHLQQLWPSGPFQWDRRSAPVTMVRAICGGRIRKIVHLDAERPLLDCRYELNELRVPVVGLEFTLSLRDERYVADAQERLEVGQWTLEEPSAGVFLTLTLDPPAQVFHFPLETISESEGGLERTYQGLSLMCCWDVGARPSWSCRVRWALERR